MTWFRRPRPVARPTAAPPDSAPAPGQHAAIVAFFQVHNAHPATCRPPRQPPLCFQHGRPLRTGVRAIDCQAYLRHEPAVVSPAANPLAVQAPRSQLAHQLLINIRRQATGPARIICGGSGCHRPGAVTAPHAADNRQSLRPNNDGNALLGSRYAISPLSRLVQRRLPVAHTTRQAEHASQQQNPGKRSAVISFIQPVNLPARIQIRCRRVVTSPRCG